MIDPIYVEVLVSFVLDIFFAMLLFLIFNIILSKKPISQFRKLFEEEKGKVTIKELDKLLDYQLDLASKIILWRLGFYISISIFVIQLYINIKDKVPPLFLFIIYNLNLVIMFYFLFDFLNFVKKPIGRRIIMEYMEIRDEINNENINDNGREEIE